MSQYKLSEPHLAGKSRSLILLLFILCFTMLAAGHTLADGGEGVLSTNVAIQFDEPASGTISNPTGKVQYTFNGTAGDLVLVRLATTSGNLDPSFELREPGAGLVCQEGTIFTFLEQQCQLNKSGVHTILISDNNDTNTGNFNLYIQSILTPANSQAIELDVHQAGTITPGVDMDAYTFSGTPGDKLLIRMTTTSGNLDPQMRIYRPDGTLLCEEDTIFTSLEHECFVDVGGTHVIFTSDGGGVNTGNFDLYMQSILTPANSQAIELDVHQAGTITPGVDMDAYTFSGTPGDKLLIRMTTTSGNLDPQMRIYRPDGTLLCEEDTIFTSLEHECFVDVGGTHVIFTSDGGGVNTGNFDLYMQSILTPANSQAIELDVHQAGTITPGVDMDAYTFSGTPGDKLLIRMTTTSGNLDPQMRIYRPDGTLLCEEDTIFTSLEHECFVDVGGTHVIFTSDGGGVNTGNFDLYMQSILTPANAIKSGYGKLETGSIAPGVEMDAFTMRATAGDKVRFTLAVTSGNLDPQIRVFRPDGTLLCEADTIFASVEKDCFLDVDGRYAIFVSTLDGVRSGNYTLNITCLFCPNTADVALQKGASHSSVEIGDTLIYTIAVSNDGPLAATNVTVTDMLPEEVQYVKATPSQGSCSVAGQMIKCNLGTMASGGKATVKIEVTAITLGVATNRAEVEAAEIDSDLGNNKATLNTTVGKEFKIYLPVVLAAS